MVIKANPTIIKEFEDIEDQRKFLNSQFELELERMESMDMENLENIE